MTNITKLTDNERKSLRNRFSKIGREKLIEMLENSLINADMNGNSKSVKKYETKIAYVRQMNGWLLHKNG